LSGQECTYCVDINAQDALGNTPLHVAVLAERLEAIKELIILGADTTKLNKKQMAPLHLAVEADKPKAIEVLYQFTEFKNC
jgi:ankyrin repeat protein